MNGKKRTLIYINSNIQTHEIIYTGINFHEFNEFLTIPIENIMVISGCGGVISLDSEFDRCFELFIGNKMVKKLAQQDIYNLGNFCFVDYGSLNKTINLSEEQLAELLYLGNMFKPLRSPFFDVLDNRFAYLSHDDGFFCKLYCREISDFYDILHGKMICLTECISNKRVERFSKDIQNRLLDLSQSGLLLDFDEMIVNNDEISLEIFIVGKYDDMDKILNNCQVLKKTHKGTLYLKYKMQKWFIEDKGTVRRQGDGSTVLTAQ